MTARTPSTRRPSPEYCALRSLEKHERRLLLGPQGPSVRVSGRAGREGAALNFCANNYLGLSADPRIVAAAHAALDSHGFGLSSVRFICGTQDSHAALEQRIAGFLGVDAAILYSSCFDANGGLFETLLGEDDAVISDALNHASIIDGIRLCKGERRRYPHGDMGALEAALVETAGKRLRMIATDGVFSMDGDATRSSAASAIWPTVISRARDGRRQPRDGLRGGDGAGDDRARGGDGPRRPRDLDAGQGARRSFRRGVRRGSARHDRPARAALSPVSLLLQLARAGRRRLRQASRRSTSSRATPVHETGSPPTPPGSGGGWPPPVSASSSRATTPSWR